MVAELLIKHWTAFSGRTLSQRASSHPSLPHSRSDVGEVKRALILVIAHDKKRCDASRHTRFRPPELAFHRGDCLTQNLARQQMIRNRQDWRCTVLSEARTPRVMKSSMWCNFVCEGGGPCDPYFIVELARTRSLTESRAVRSGHRSAMFQINTC
jgi:hypothetical protein